MQSTTYLERGRYVRGTLERLLKNTPHALSQERGLWKKIHQTSPLLIWKSALPTITDDHHPKHTAERSNSRISGELFGNLDTFSRSILFVRQKCPATAQEKSQGMEIARSAVVLETLVAGPVMEAVSLTMRLVTVAVVVGRLIVGFVVELESAAIG